MQKIKNLKVVPNVIFAEGALSELHQILSKKKGDSGYAVFIIDHYFTNSGFEAKLQLQPNDLCFYLDTTNEPTTVQVDDYVENILTQRHRTPDAIIGIGGGSTLDVAKAVSIMLNNPGRTETYQGWDLVKNPGVYKIGIPTISGTGSEVSRTTVLIGPKKKQGINSDFSLFDQIILDPTLLQTVPQFQRFYTGMDCYIHCVESITGTFINEFSYAFAHKALNLCRDVFLKNGSDADLMVASYFGGSSIVYSEVGVCHALSYGLSYLLGFHHGIANCIVFNHLDEYYPDYMPEFREMLTKNEITLPQKIDHNLTEHDFERMIDVTLLMEKPLHNALGPNWRNIMTRDRIKEMYLKILGNIHDNGHHTSTRRQQGHPWEKHQSDCRVPAHLLDD